MKADMEHETTLIDQLLEDQARPGTAVKIFSDWHEGHSCERPSQSKYYQKLIPLSKPKQGEQYSFEVDLDKCTGCKACVAACHSLNGLDENESWRDIGALVGSKKQPYLQTVTTACHHCLDPACSNGCPVLAYEKDEDTGIVRHLDDQCIGCSYCILKCPYEVPKFNLKRGIVRKCDMCHQRLSEGEAPACVQSCPNEAIAIRIVKTSDLREKTLKSDARLLPGAFESSYTSPTTNYISQKGIPSFARSQTEGQLTQEEAHWPLAWMLVFTQLATGLFISSFAVSSSKESMMILNVSAFMVHAVGLLLSVLHLGQPFRAWRAFLGWRKSWLSREIMVFGAFAKVAFLAAIWPWIPQEYQAMLPSWIDMRSVTGVTAFIGIVGVICSTMVYVDTRRPFWAWAQTFSKFAGTSLLLGFGASAVLLSRFQHSSSFISNFILATLAVQVVLGLYSIVTIKRALSQGVHAWHESAAKMYHMKRVCLRWQVGLGLGAIFLWSATLSDVPLFSVYLVPLAFMMNFVSQLMERHLFFTCVTAPRMPGVRGSFMHGL